jgi:hypothetical protein
MRTFATSSSSSSAARFFAADSGARVLALAAVISAGFDGGEHGLTAVASFSALFASALRSASASGATGIVLLKRRADFVRLVDAALASGAAMGTDSHAGSTCCEMISLRADIGFGADVASRL